MKKSVGTIFIFSIPFFLYALIIVVVDPYNYVNVSGLIDDKTKIDVFKRSNSSSPRGTILWKALRYKRKPVKNILIGDSQGNAIQEKMVEELTGEEIFNFCTPGSSYETMFDSFWYCMDISIPKKVYFQVGFMNFNKNRSYNLFNNAQDYLDKPYYYFMNKDILFDSFCNIAYWITRDTNLVSKPAEFYNINWQNDLSEYYLKLFFGKYEFPKEFLAEFNKISDYCKMHDIELNFIILPVYKRVNEYLAENDLLSTKERFISEIRDLGTLYDYTDFGGISEQRNHFYDYFHPKEHIIDSIVGVIWGPQASQSKTVH